MKKGDRIDLVGAVISEKSVTVPWTSLFRAFAILRKATFGFYISVHPSTGKEIKRTPKKQIAGWCPEGY